MRYVEVTKSVRGLLFTFVLSIFLAGCGYHIAGKSGSMPGGITEVTIPVFVNSTTKPDIEGIMTSAFVSEFITTVDVNKKADSVINAEIRSYNLNGVSFSQTDVTQEYRLSVVLALTLKDKKDGYVLWEDRAIRDYEDFKVDTTDVTRTEEVEIEVFRKLSKDLARKIKERMLEGF
ncbi:MAG: LPS assembly lipoprotein LptE [Thermodesulfobacteriota bacterium]